jgi:hypothetical protein
VHKSWAVYFPQIEAGVLSGQVFQVVYFTIAFLVETNPMILSASTYTRQCEHSSIAASKFSDRSPWWHHSGYSRPSEDSIANTKLSGLCYNILSVVLLFFTGCGLVLLFIRLSLCPFALFMFRKFILKLFSDSRTQHRWSRPYWNQLCGLGRYGKKF